MTEINGGQLIARTLADAGVTHAFGVHGGHLDALLVAMAEEGITLVDTRHEAAAGNAAQSYATATGKLGVVFCTSGPGFTNAYSAITNAHLDRVPVLFLTSSPPQRDAELNVLQAGLDQIAAAKPVTRWAHRVTTVARVPDLTATAIRMAQSGVPGPTVLETPIDVMFRTVDEASVPRPTVFQIDTPVATDADVARAADLIASAERPIVVLGAGAARSLGAREEVEALLELTGAPVAETTMAVGTLAADTPALIGGATELAMLQLMGSFPDLVVLLGARRGMMTGGRSGSMIPDGAKVIHIDVDPGELGKIGNAEVAAVSDVAGFVAKLNDVLRGRDVPDSRQWRQQALAARGVADTQLRQEEPVDAAGRLHPFHASEAIWDALRADELVVADGGESSGWTSAAARAARPGFYQGIGLLGGLGIGTGFSIGMAVAHPGHRVVAVTGDGAMGFNLQEWETMARRNLPITTVVMNNLGWAMSYHGQDAIYGPGKRVVSDLPDVRYDRIAESFGLYAERVESIEEIPRALERARDHGGPACIDIAIATDVVHAMMLPLSAELPEGSTRLPYYEPIPAGEV